MLLTSLFLLSFPCAAAENAKITLEEKTADAGDEVELVLSISDNPGIAILSLTFFYEEDALTLLEGVNGEILPTLDTGVNFFFSADGNCKNDGVLATLKFKVSPSAAGIYPVTFKIRECWNEDYEKLQLSGENGAIKVNIDDIEADITEPLPPYEPSAPVTTAEATVTPPLPTTTAPTEPVIPATQPVTVPVTEPIVIPAVTTTVAITTAKPAVTEPVVTEAPTVTEAPIVTEAPTVTEAPVVTEVPTVTESPAITEPTVTEGPSGTQTEQAGTEATSPVTQPVGNTQENENSLPVPVIAAICVAVVAVAIILFFLVKRKR